MTTDDDFDDDADLWGLIDNAPYHPADELRTALLSRNTRAYVIFHFAGHKNILHIPKALAIAMLADAEHGNVQAVVNETDIYLIDERGV